MAQGGARNRSGPSVDPGSGRSDRRGLVLTSLQPYVGEAPEFPLPDVSVRELEVWVEAWRTPQASAWAAEPWRLRTVALWVRWSVRTEDPECGAGLVAQAIRLADQVGMTPAGLKENGWRVAGEAVVPVKAARPASPRLSARDRLRVVEDAG